MFDHSRYASKLRAAKCILIAEDDLDDQLFIHDALIENGVREEQIKFVNDGVELLEYLRFSEYPPSIILLDINMPRKGGKEALKDIQEMPEYKLIPKVMLSTSDHEEDINECFNLGVSTYLKKPHNVLSLKESLNSLLSLFFGFSELPH